MPAMSDSRENEENLSERLYNWFKFGGKWGDVDTSGEYIPGDDDDTTSVISMATTTTDNEWSDIDDGQRTPTRDSPYLDTRESTPHPESTLDLTRLSQLLDPKTKEEQEEAKLLSRHLQSPGILTRSQYRRLQEREKAKVLLSSRFSMSSQPTPEDEERMLETYILERRNNTHAKHNPSSTGGTWDSGADGMGSEGPQCVVCQLSPRTVLVWPCGCLSLCDECRVGLASKNYTTCVCCRSSVVAYSRLYVP